MPAVVPFIPLIAAGLGVAGTVYAASESRKSANKQTEAALAAANQPAVPAAPAAPPATPAAAAAKVPDQAALRRQNMAGAPPPATMLTGPGGVDPTSLALGKNNLLGL